jgi:alpha,alpha-trehalase
MSILDRNSIDAIILDLDGVVTDTASLHEQAWKTTFDSFLSELSKNMAQPMQLFTHEDYLLYLDGKPRFRGAQDFLHSRGIDLPSGYHDDPSGFFTVSSIANQKNRLYFRYIDEQGVSVFPDTRAMLTKWKIQGFKLALISSSKSCHYIIERAGISGAFDTIVDGNDLITMRLNGKPHPDMFLYAADKLGAKYARTAIIEDAVSGIEAGKKGNFGATIGVARTGTTQLLLEHGADKVVVSLRELSNPPQNREIQELPSLNLLIEEFFSNCQFNKTALFLDYDGTLTPIVSHPEDARLSSHTRNILQQLSKKCIVAIVSGRDRSDIEALVNIPTLYYAGNHGFDITGPGNLSFVHPKVSALQPHLSRAEACISESLSSIPGILIERKQFSIAVHYRLVSQEYVEKIKSELDIICDIIDGFKITAGKKVFEFQPDVNWDKGDAVLWLIEKILPVVSLSPDYTFMYMGDDITDEDAFREVAEIGIPILVGSHGAMTTAKYHLENVTETNEFLQKLVDTIP